VSPPRVGLGIVARFELESGFPTRPFRRCVPSVESMNFEGGAMRPATSQTRELAARESDGIHALLLWDPPAGYSIAGRAIAGGSRPATSQPAAAAAAGMPTTIRKR